MRVRLRRVPAEDVNILSTGVANKKQGIIGSQAYPDPETRLGEHFSGLALVPAFDR
jgi:hypothetical protein